jgi:spore coat protein U-like protein
MNTLSIPHQFRRLSPVLLLLCAAVAHAETNTGNLGVSATIETGCSVSASAMAFGVVVPGTDKDTEAVVSVLCTSGTTYTLDLGDGLYQISTGGSSGNLYRRHMASAANRLPYMFFQEPTRVTEIAASVANTNFITSTVGDGSTQTFTVYGRVVGTESSSSPPGSYSDTVIITVAF